MAKHKSKAFNNELKRAKKMGCQIKRVSKGYQILGTDGTQYICHEGEKAYHPLRRYLDSVMRSNSQ